MHANVIVEEYAASDWLREEFDGIAVDTLVGADRLAGMVSVATSGAEVYAELALAA